jgi:hypothetical protein
MTAEVLELKRDLIEQNLDRVAIEIKKAARTPRMKNTNKKL